MLFNSLRFALFFPAVLAALYAAPRAWRTRVLLLASLVFYGAWKIEYLALMLVFSTIDWWVVNRMADAPPEQRTRWLAVTLTSNFGILFVFKYWNLVNGTLRQLLVGWPVRDLDLVLPVGISFYTFQTMGYAIDVYRGTLPAIRELPRFGLFIWYFPQLVAGPIERATHLLPQLEELRDFDLERLASGLRLVGWGLFKKVVVADRLAVVVDRIFGAPTEFSGFGLVVGTVFFSFQVYYDFAGYSEIAMGVSRVMGIELMRNFDHPYHAKSMAELWTRWHVSLTTWFRDYLYFPLGGNRVSFARWCGIVLLVYGISGMWHGARWTFLAWGLANGLVLIADRATKPTRDRVAGAVGLTGARRAWVALPLTQLVWLVTVIPFRASSVSDMLWFYTRVWVGWEYFGHPYAFGLFLNKINVEPLPFAFALLLMPLTELLDAAFYWPRVLAWWHARSAPFRMTGDWVLWLSVLFFGVWTDSPFLYFQF